MVFVADPQGILVELNPLPVWIAENGATQAPIPERKDLFGPGLVRITQGLFLNFAEDHRFVRPEEMGTVSFSRDSKRSTGKND